MCIIIAAMKIKCSNIALVGESLLIFLHRFFSNTLLRGLGWFKDFSPWSQAPKATHLLPLPLRQQTGHLNSATWMLQPRPVIQEQEWEKQKMWGQHRVHPRTRDYSSHPDPQGQWASGDANQAGIVGDHWFWLPKAPCSRPHPEYSFPIFPFCLLMSCP